jgi:putative FmdB family regulatory protein
LRYDYACEKCSTKKQRFVFEIVHGMNERPIIKCPKCGSVAYRMISPAIFYVKGNGYLDRAGVRRDQNLHTLIYNDPYKHMRQRGEKDELICQLRRAGKYRSRGR